jgi:hypothetical protein
MNVCMVDEVAQPIPSFLDEVKQVRDDIMRERITLEKVRDEIKQLKTEDILSGKAPSIQPVVAVEEDPRDYVKRVTGIDLKKK